MQPKHTRTHTHERREYTTASHTAHIPPLPLTSSNHSQQQHSPYAASSLCSTAAIPNDARSTLSPLVSMRCPPSPRRHTHRLPCGGACDRQPPITTAATTGTCAHEDPKCRPHRASSASRMMMPHSSATQPQPQSSADRTSARKPQRLPPRKPPSHTHPHACTHTHT